MLHRVPVVNAIARRPCFRLVSVQPVEYNNVSSPFADVLYPFGRHRGDTAAGVANNWHDGPISIPNGFNFLGIQRATIYVSHSRQWWNFHSEIHLFSISTILV